MLFGVFAARLCRGSIPIIESWLTNQQRKLMASHSHGGLAMERTWLESTGQKKKMNLSVALLLVAVGLAGAGSFAKLLGYRGNLVELVRAAATVIVLAAFIYPLVTIKCRNCGVRVLAYFVRHSQFYRWMPDFQAATSCPKCGHKPSAAREDGSVG